MANCATTGAVATTTTRQAHYRRGERPCEACRDAYNEWQRDRYVPRERRPAAPPAHGTNARYEAGCRCDRCRTAGAQYHRRYRRLKKAADIVS